MREEERRERLDLSSLQGKGVRVCVWVYKVVARIIIVLAGLLAIIDCRSRHLLFSRVVVVATTTVSDETVGLVLLQRWEFLRERLNK